MTKRVVDYTTYVNETLDLLADPGLLLVSLGKEGPPNAMTIGWGTVGTIWGRAIFTVLVRPSRYTFGLLESSESFTVNLPSPGLQRAVSFCGTHSGRDFDKFAECDMSLEPSNTVDAPGIAESPVIYECRVVHVNDVVNATLDPDIVAGSYESGDFHRIYYGEILCVRAAKDARELLASAQ